MGAPAKVTSAVAVKPGASSLQILTPLLDWMRTSRSDEASLLMIGPFYGVKRSSCVCTALTSASLKSMA